VRRNPWGLSIRRCRRCGYYACRCGRVVLRYTVANLFRSREQENVQEGLKSMAKKNTGRKEAPKKAAPKRTAATTKRKK